MAVIATPERRALVWISGLGEKSTDQSAEGFSRRLAIETDHLDPADATYEVRTRATAESATAPPSKDPACTIVRTEGGVETSATDVYVIATEDVLVGRFRRQPLLAKLALVSGVLVLHFHKLIRVFATRGKTRRERAQLLYAQVGALLLVIAFVGLLAGLAGTIATEDVDGVPKWAEALVAGFGGLAIWKSKIFTGLADSGLVVAKFMRYLDHPGDADRELRGRLYALLDDLGEGEEYSRIDVVAYSFGAVVAVDGCFPQTDRPPPPVEQIKTLVTVAMPFDFICAYWPDYFTERYARELPGEGWWVNVYSPSDILSSNFANDAAPSAPPVVGVVVDGDSGSGAPAVLPSNRVYRLNGASEPASFFKALALDGLKMHTGYWDEDIATATVFGQVAQALELGPQPVPAGGAN